MEGVSAVGAAYGYACALLLSAARLWPSLHKRLALSVPVLSSLRCLRN
jgi:hypothetical protein